MTSSSADEHVRLAVRCLVLQAAVAIATEVPYSQGRLGDIIATLMFALLILIVVALVRTGTPLSRLTALVFEAGVLGYGLYELLFLGSYHGGSIVAVVVLGVLLHPAAARAFSRPGMAAPQPIPETGDGGGPSAPADPDGPRW